MKATLRLLTASLCTFFSTAQATDYVFIGNGDWTSSNNWENGLMPAGPITGGNTIIIKGNASVGIACTNCSANTLLNNAGTIIIAPGGTLTLQNLTQLTHIGSLIVNGTLINHTSFEVFAGSTVTVSGVFINQKSIANQGTITVNSGGKIENRLSSSLTGIASPAAIGTLVINSGGTVVNKNTAVLNPGKLINNGTIDNQATLTGEVSLTGDLINNGTLSPGNSPGTFAVTGNYTASSSSMHNFEVGGKNNYDKLSVGGTVNLSGILNVTLINGFVPNSDHELTIVTGNIKGTFTSVYKPAKYVVIYNAHSVVLRYNASLPMLYIRLDVKKEGSGAKLFWEVHNEPSITKYEIERSVDGKNFQKISTVTATMTGNYHFTDQHPKDKNFYRIKAIDVGGTYRFSSVVSMQHGKAGIALTAYPSPAQSTITVQHASAGSAGKIIITSIDGRIIKTVQPQKGSQQTSVDVHSVNKGAYVVQFQNGTDHTEAFMFAKQ